MSAAAVSAVRRAGAMVIFAASAMVSLALGAFLVGFHTPYENKPVAFQKLLDSIGKPRPGSWQAVHILAAGCACSRRIAEHLLTRGSLPVVDEKIVFIGASSDLASSLVRVGFHIRTITHENIVARLGIVGAPWLVITSPQGQIRYSGGYTSSTDWRAGYQDVSILRRLATGVNVSALPAYGCAIGHRLQSRLDPLGLKYQ